MSSEDTCRQTGINFFPILWWPESPPLKFNVNLFCKIIMNHYALYDIKQSKFVVMFFTKP